MFLRIFFLMCLLAVGSLSARAEEQLVLPPHTIYENGHFTETWFLDSFLDLREDALEAQNTGKGLVVIWEQRGCPGCRKMHLINFADDEIRAFIQKHFVVVQMDLFGAREVTDFDGEKMEERALARKYAIRGTPGLQFYPPKGGIGEGNGRTLEIQRFVGYLEPKPFLNFFKFVQSEAYRDMGFPQYLKGPGS